MKNTDRRQSLRDASGIATSLSDFFSMLAPASPTTNENLRDAYGIRVIREIRVQKSCVICLVCVNQHDAKRPF